jgi:hypothetical protein
MKKPAATRQKEKTGVGELRYDEAQTRSPTRKMIFLILSRNRKISKS